MSNWKQRLGVVLIAALVLSTSISTSAQADREQRFIERMHGFSEGYFVAGVWNKEWTYGYVDQTGKWMIDPQWNYAGSFHDGLAVVGTRTDYKSPMTYGYIRKDGTSLTSIRYTSASDFESGYAVVGIGSASQARQGLIDHNGKEILPPVYDAVSIYTDKDTSKVAISLQRDGKHGLYVPEGNKLFEAEYDQPLNRNLDFVTFTRGQQQGLYFISSGKEMFPIEGTVDLISESTYDADGVAFTLRYVGLIGTMDGKLGMWDMQGHTKLEFVFTKIKPVEGDFLLAELNGKWSIYKTNGTLLIRDQYDSVSAYNWRHLLLVKSNGKVGLLQQDGRYLITPRYDNFYNFSADGVAIVTLAGKQGLIDRTGKEIFPPRYDYINFNDQAADGTPLIRAHRDGRDEFYQMNFKPYTPGGSSALGDFDTIGPFENGIARVEKNGKVGYVDTHYAYIVRPIYDSAYLSDHDGKASSYFTIKNGTKWGMVLLDGTEFVPAFDSPPNVGDRIAVGQINNSYRYRTADNTYLNSDSYVYAEAFNEGKALVAKEHGKYYFIDTSGKKVSPEYKTASSYGDGVAFVSQGNFGSYIDHDGQPVLGEDMKMPRGFAFSNGIAPAQVLVPDKNRYLYGVLKRDGTWLVKPQFDSIVSYGGDKYGYMLNGKEAEITPEGKIIWK